MLFAWSTIVTSLISQSWRFKLGFKGSGYRFCNVFVPDIAVFTMVCRLLLSIKITIVLRWTIAFRTNCIWSKMTLLNKVCHTVGKTSRACRCVFVAEGLHSGCSPGLVACVPTLPRRRSFGRAQTGLHLCPSSPAFLHKPIFALNKFFNHTCNSHLPFNKCRNPDHDSWLPYAPPPHTPSSLHLNTC